MDCQHPKRYSDNLSLVQCTSIVYRHCTCVINRAKWEWEMNENDRFVRFPKSKVRMLPIFDKLMEVKLNLCKASTAKPLIFSLQAFSWTCSGNNFLALVRQGAEHEKMVVSVCTKTSCSIFQKWSQIAILERATPPVNSVAPEGPAPSPFFLSPVSALAPWISVQS